MGKCAFLFPGQGSQEIGMGADLIDPDPFTADLLAIGSDLAHEDLKELCRHGPARKLLHPACLQPALVAVCLGYWKKLAATGVVPDYIAGHSLGEITSLAVAGIVSPDDCIKIAAKRGRLMENVAAACNGGMLAIMFISVDIVEKLLAEIAEPRRIVIANDNAPDQVVVSGDVQLLDRVAARIAAEKLGKTRRVDVLGPWHSPFMNDAQLEFEQWVTEVPFTSPRLPVVFNATASSESDPMVIKQLVTGQLTRPVYWRTSMETINAAGVDTLYEIGPQRVLSGLARINGFKKGTAIHNINNLRGIERLHERVPG